VISLHPRRIVLLLCVPMSVIAVQPRSSNSQDLLNDNPQYSPFNLELRPYATLPTNSKNIISMTTRPGDARLYVTTQEGQIHVIDQDGTANGRPVLWFDVASAESILGHPLHGRSSQAGLQSLAFHPDFNRHGMPGYGKLYTTMLEQRPESPLGHFYLGDSAHGTGIPADGVLAEWTFNHQAGLVDVNSYRELFRVNMPVYDHPIKQARFNPYARPGDETYGLLYMTHGDANIKHSPNDDPQQLGNVLGKMLRIDPLQSATERYSIPDSNPLVTSNDPGVLKEIYAYGMRNPHTFSFNRDPQGNVHILAGDIGRNNVEEINSIVSGGNYGWPKREGTFAHSQVPESDPNAGYITGVAALPPNEVLLGYSFPMAQFDHNAMFGEIGSGNAIASGFVLRNGFDVNLHDQLIFNNFANHDGIVYHADFGEILDAVDRLIADDPHTDEPSELTQAVLHKIRLSLDHDNDMSTPPQLYDDFLQLLNAPRSDTRYGEGVFGEMYISSKTNGQIYLVTNSIPLFGDYNGDGAVEAADYTIWRSTFGETGYQLAADGNGNGHVDARDYDIWRAHFGAMSSSGSSLDLALRREVPEPNGLLILFTVTFASLMGRHSCAVDRYVSRTSH
jgi:Glucose / Sorbosone dehydrogenase